MSRDQRKSVLVVDDDDSVRELLTECLSVEYDVLSARNGAVAKQMLATIQVDLVLTDLHMPGGNGDELARHIKITQPELVVIIHSGSLDTFVPVVPLREVAEVLLKKPCTFTELVTTVRTQLMRAERRTVTVNRGRARLVRAG